MDDLQRIYRVVARVRRRLRLQLALEAATTTAILAVAGALAVLWLRRMEIVSAESARLAFAGLGAAVVLAALAGARRRLPTSRVAARIDRASGLSDRLGTACDFSARLRDGSEALHPDTVALMRAAVKDGIAAVPRADVKAAAPFRAPRDMRALGVFGGLALAVALLSFGPRRPGGDGAVAAGAPAPAAAAGDRELMDPEDVDYQRQFVEDMKELARQTGDQSLDEMARELDKLLNQAARGAIGKEELLAKMETLEKKYSAAGDDDLDATLSDLKAQGKALAKQRATRKLGEALEKGDLEQAQKELQKLADDVEQGKLKPEQQKQLAAALERAVQEQEKREQRRAKQEEAQAQQQIAKKKDEIRRLERKLDQEPQNEEVRRTLQKERRELEKLERDRKEQAQKRQRHLERLSRNLREAAENLRQKNRKQAAENLRQGAEDEKRFQNQQRRAANQKRVRSRLSELKDAIRRARPHKGNGRARELARRRRIQEWEQRARGGKGNPQAWRSGQQKGSGKEDQLGRQGQQQGGPRWGDEHDPNLTGDPTAMRDKLKDEHLSGMEGAGPSRRETILTSAKKGFARAAYRKVYADYRKVVEEVMSQEKVPQGYRYYVKRYFQRIKPHSTE